MTLQSNFMIVAPIQPGRLGAMRRLLATMTRGHGAADPNNALVPFSRFENLHSARLVVLDDRTLGDSAALYGVQRPDPPIYLAFLGDFDGSYNEFIDLLIQHAAPGLRQIFSLCEGYSPGEDLRSWIIAHEHSPSAYYCNWVGRTVRQTREEEQLRLALRHHLELAPDLADSPGRTVHDTLRKMVKDDVAAGRLTLTPEAATPLGWKVRHILDWATIFILLAGFVLTLPLTFIPLLFLAWRLRSQEKSAPEFAPRPEPEQAASLAAQEDYTFANQFSAMGPWKPGWLRALIIPLVLWIINLTAKTIYTRGRLTRIQTIHFARWVYLENRARVFFASDYDGSLESYNEDFINKVSIGLNLVFSNGVGYPRTAWLVSKGAKHEQLFKYFLRRHQVPTDVWYFAHTGLTAFDLRRNSAIRQGLEMPAPGEQQLREWLALL